jgi:hypothetical protein
LLVISPDKIQVLFFTFGILLAKQPLNYKFISLDIRFLLYKTYRLLTFGILHDIYAMQYLV